MNKKVPDGSNPESNADGEKNQTDNEADLRNESDSQDQNEGVEEVVKDPKALLKKSRELLASNKKLRGELDQMKNEISSIKTEKAKNQNDWKKLYEEEVNAHKGTKDQLGKITTDTQNALKMGAVLEALPGKVDKKYFGLLQGMLEDVDVSGDGEVDEDSVNAVAVKFQKLYPETIVKPGSKMPNESAKNPDVKLDVTAWQKSGDVKKMREQLPHLVQAYREGKLKI